MQPAVSSGLRMTRRLRGLLAAALCGLFASPAGAGDGGGVFVGRAADLLQLGAGAFAAVKQRDRPDRAGEGRIEYRSGFTVWHVGPLAGLMVNSNGGVFAYVALYLDIRIGPWTLTPAFGGGYYGKGKGKELGGEAEFHGGLDLGYRLANGHRLGIKVTHVSNGNTQERNPGTESVLLTWSVPLRFD